VYETVERALFPTTEPAIGCKRKLINSQSKACQKKNRSTFDLLKAVSLWLDCSRFLCIFATKAKRISYRYDLPTHTSFLYSFSFPFFTLFLLYLDHVLMQSICQC
jgi:hypothetical protein